MLTVPKVIASGESVTIPAGRVAVLPDLQVDGDLVVDGDLFIPTGSMTSQVVQKVASTDNAVVRFDGVTGQVQNSGVIINDNGNVGIGTSNPSNALDIVGTTTNSAGIVSVRPNGTGTLSVIKAINSSDATNYSFGQIVARADKITLDSSKSGTGTYLPLVLGTGAGYSFMLDTIGNSLHINPNGGLGYGTGAGGTVTQLTNKGTAVTLNKPTGRIILNNSALAAGATIGFTFNNSLISTSGDSLLVTINDPVSGYNYRVDVAGLLGGIGAQIRVTNISGTTLSDSVSLDFSIIKGAIA